MKKQLYINEPSFSAQSTKVNNNVRKQHTILVKPCYEGKPYPCYESGFDATLQCPRVIRLNDMRKGIEEHTPEELYDLKGKQPLFYLQEQFSKDGRWQWNGRLLYCVNDAAHARKVIREHADELNIILSFEDPDTHRYFFLIDTGSENLTEEAFRKKRSEMDWFLKQYFCHTIHHDLNFYCRALTDEYYDIVDRDALFGNSVEGLEFLPCKPAELERKVEGNSLTPHPSSLTHTECEVRTCEPVSVGSLLKSVFGRIFSKAI